jgi:hypothetical protein
MQKMKVNNVGKREREKLTDVLIISLDTMRWEGKCSQEYMAGKSGGATPMRQKKFKTLGGQCGQEGEGKKQVVKQDG